LCGKEELKESRRGERKGKKNYTGSDVTHCPYEGALYRRFSDAFWRAS
jgi:hypothetical protein